MKISIITINLNNAKGLEKTICSVISQSYNDIEYIIIDGGSTDGSVDIINKYSLFISKWISEKDKGIYEAMNKGLMMASGEYSLFLNSGDILVKDSIISSVFHKTQHRADLIYGSVVNIKDNNKSIVEYPNPEYITFRHFLESSLPHPCTFIKTDFIKKIGGYDESLYIVADWKFFIIAIFLYNAQIFKLHFPISEYNNDGISSLKINKNKIKNERDKVLKDGFYRFLLDYNYLDKIERLPCVKGWILFKKFKRWLIR